MNVQPTIGPRRGRRPRFEVDGHWHNESLVVVGVLPYQVHASGRAEQSGRRIEALAKVLPELICLGCEHRSHVRASEIDVMVSSMDHSCFSSGRICRAAFFESASDSESKGAKQGSRAAVKSFWAASPGEPPSLIQSPRKG